MANSPQLEDLIADGMHLEQPRESEQDALVSAIEKWKPQEPPPDEDQRIVELIAKMKAL